MMSYDEVSDEFRSWCVQIARQVATIEPQLLDAFHQGRGDSFSF
jgi:hypothetical protein